MRSSLLDGEDITFANHLLERMMMAENDAEYYKMKVDGDWPGWEWVKEERIKRKL